MSEEESDSGDCKECEKWTAYRVDGLCSMCKQQKEYLESDVEF